MEAHRIDSPFQFITAGKAIFTVQNGATGKRFTYRVAGPGKPKGYKADTENDDRLFVSVLTGSDNASARSYTYVGTVMRRKTFYPGSVATIPATDPRVLAFSWLWPRLVQLTPEKFAEIYPSVEICHCGLCGRCGRLLTVPESLHSGLGPECVKLMEAGK